MADTDCTWISHSVLQRRLENSPDREDSVCGEKTGRSHIIPIFYLALCLQPPTNVLGFRHLLKLMIC